MSILQCLSEKRIIFKNIKFSCIVKTTKSFYFSSKTPPHIHHLERKKYKIQIFPSQNGVVCPNKKKRLLFYHCCLLGSQVKGTKTLPKCRRIKENDWIEIFKKILTIF